MITAFVNRFKGMSRDLALFFVVSFGVGLAGSLVESTFNNFLNESYTLRVSSVHFLEIPRELPGFLVVFVSALLWFHRQPQDGRARDGIICALACF